MGLSECIKIEPPCHVGLMRLIKFVNLFLLYLSEPYNDSRPDVKTPRLSVRVKDFQTRTIELFKLFYQAYAETDMFLCMVRILNLLFKWIKEMDLAKLI